MFKKVFFNNTSCSFLMTLYIGGDPIYKQPITESKVASLAPHSSIEIEYGDLKHGFINGLRLQTEIAGLKVEHLQMIQQANQELNDVLNNSFVIEINSFTPMQLKKVN